jgi:hypothetical protein
MVCDFIRNFSACDGLDGEMPEVLPDRVTVAQLEAALCSNGTATGNVK